MKGNRDCDTGLWRINLYHKKTNCNNSQKQPEIHSTNNVYALCNTGASVNYLHNVKFSCTKSALLHAVKKGHLATWSGLTVEGINTHLNLTTATAIVKLRPLPQPQLCARTYAETNPSAQRATQLRSVLARMCSVSRQNLNTTTVP
jgi:hypothetical protein